MEPRFLTITRRFIRYSMHDVGGKNASYEQLTPQERVLCSPEEFAEMLEWAYEGMTDEEIATERLERP